MPGGRVTPGAFVPTVWKQLLPAWVAALVLLPAVAKADVLGAHYTLDVQVADDLRAISGVVRAEVRNDGDEPLDELLLWLYPNVFQREPDGIDDGNRPFYEPFGDPRGGIEVEDVQLDGSPVVPQEIGLPAAPEGTARSISLAEPLPPGGRAVIELRFVTRIPHRLGPLSWARGVLTALGGWHPWVGTRTEEFLDRAPAPADWLVQIAVPEGHVALVGGRVAPDRPFHLSERPWLDLVVRPERAPLETRGGPVWPLGSRPHDRWEKSSEPDPAPFTTVWTGDEIAHLITELERWADGRPEIPDPGPFAVVVVPMRSEIALATPGILAVSDRAFAVTPLQVVRALHARGVARAWFARRFLPFVERCEAPGLARIIADGLGVIWADRFIVAYMGGAADAREILGPFDFIPDVDDFLRSPRNPFPHVYFRPVADPVPVRDEPWTFNRQSPRGRLLLTKVEDWIGAEDFAGLLHDYMSGEVCPLQAGAEAKAGEPLDELFTTWTRSLPREDLRVQLLSTEELDDGRWQSEVEVWRLGDAPPEVIEVAAWEKDGDRHLLVWRAEEGEHVHAFTVVSDAPIDRLRVDPRGRVAQTPANPTELAVRGDYVPSRLQFLLTGFAVSYSSANDTLFGDLDVLLRPREEVRRRLGLGASYREARLQARTSLNFGFGPLVGAARYAWNWGVGLSVDYLRAGYGGDEITEGFAVGPSLRLWYDDRPLAAFPLRGTAFFTATSVSAGANRGGDSSVYGAVAAGAVRLVPTGHRSTIALRLKASTILGEAPVQELYPIGGSDAALRGFPLQAALSRDRVVASVEWRHPLIADMDVDLGLARLRQVSGAIFVDGAWANRLHALEVDTPSSAVFADAGYGLRFEYDILGVRPLTLAVDAAVPVNRGAATDVPPVVFSVRAGQSFLSP